jgi:uncharacterized protein YkwD
MSATSRRDEERCFALLNEFRSQQGQRPLVLSSKLTDLARPHSQAMCSGAVPFGHDGFKERAAKVQGARATAENVGFRMGGTDLVQAMFTKWTESPGHRKNMLGDFEEVGIALAGKDNQLFGTQLFARYK